MSICSNTDGLKIVGSIKEGQNLYNPRISVSQEYPVTNVLSFVPKDKIRKVTQGIEYADPYVKAAHDYIVALILNNYEYWKEHYAGDSNPNMGDDWRASLKATDVPSLYFPAGRYRFQSTIDKWPQVRVFGDGQHSVLSFEPLEDSYDKPRDLPGIIWDNNNKYSPTYDLAYFIRCIPKIRLPDGRMINSTRNEIRDLRIESRANAIGIAILGTQLNFWVKNIHFHNWGTADDGSRYTGLGIAHVTMTSPQHDKNGYEIVPNNGWSTDMFLEQCFFEGGRMSAVLSGHDLQIRNCAISNCKVGLKIVNSNIVNIIGNTFSAMDNTTAEDTAIAAVGRSINISSNTINKWYKGVLVRGSNVVIGNNIIETVYNADQKINYHGWGVHAVPYEWRASGTFDRNDPDYYKKITTQKGEADLWTGGSLGGASYGKDGPYVINGNLFGVVTDMSRRPPLDSRQEYPVNYKPIYLQTYRAKKYGASIHGNIAETANEVLGDKDLYIADQGVIIV